jgi:hypothetical protein
MSIAPDRLPGNWIRVRWPTVQFPETVFERATKEERNKERVERQKLLVSLPRSKPEQSMFALLTEIVAELRKQCCGS